MSENNQVIFNINDINVKLSSNDPKIIDDLNKLYGSYYEVGNNADFCINYIVGSNIKTNISYKEKNQSDDNYIERNGCNFNVYMSKYTENDRDFVKRIYTTVLIKLLQLDGYTIIHGACIAKDNKAIIISGNKRAGKTTTMLNLLKRGYNYVSNDRIAIKRINDTIVAIGIPFSMGIIKSDITANINPDEFKIDKDGDKEKIYVENYQIPKVLNVNIQPTAIVKSIIVPSYDQNTKSLNISVLDNPIAYLGDNIMTDNSIPEDKSFLNDIFKVDYKSCDYIDLIPTYLVIQNKYTFDDLNDFINDSIIKGENKDVLRLTRAFR